MIKCSYNRRRQINDELIYMMDHNIFANILKLSATHKVTKNNMSTNWYFHVKLFTFHSFIVLTNRDIRYSLCRSNSAPRLAITLFYSPLKFWGPWYRVNGVSDMRRVQQNLAVEVSLYSKQLLHTCIVYTTIAWPCK